MWHVTPPQADISVILTLVTNCNHAWSKGNYDFYLSNYFCLLQHLPKLAFTHGKCLPRQVNARTSVNRSSLNTALHPVLHSIIFCYIRSAVVLLELPAYAFSLFTILGLSTVAISDSILAKDVTLDCSKACICFVHWSRNINFASWLDNIDEFRCSTAEIASITTMFWPCQLFFVKCMRATCIIISGLKPFGLSIRSIHWNHPVYLLS